VNKDILFEDISLSPSLFIKQIEIEKEYPEIEEEYNLYLMGLPCVAY